MRYAICVEYDGSQFSGWQRQAGTLTVQGALESALSRVADEPIRVVGAGRTDAGVHACGQIAHFDTDRVRSDHAWLRGANTLTPRGVVIVEVRPVAETFHARFSATGRVYRYVILNRPVAPTYLSGRVTWAYHQLDTARMHDGSRWLLGEHDFDGFRAAACQARNSVRQVHRVDVRRSGNWVWMDVEANAFLHHMVRNFAGALMAVGTGARPPEWISEVLGSRDRTRGGITAPADGLYLTRVCYPLHCAAPQPSAPCRFW